MEPEAYRSLAARERMHWFCVGRRRIVDAVLGDPRDPSRARVLEIGSGTGGNVPMLRRHGTLTCLEPSALGRALTLERVEGALDLRDGMWPHDSGLAADERFDLVAMLDVLEHVDDPAAALDEVRARLAPGGRVVVTVPAYRWMWSTHDRVLHHRTRYTMRGLRAELAAADLRVDAMTCFNTVLFPAAALARGACTLLRIDRSPGQAVPSPAVNGMLGAAFGAEVPFVRRGMRLPFGLSVLAVASAA